METQKPKILVVDDEEIVLESCRRILEGQGYEAVCVLDGPEGLRLLREEDFDVVLTDLKVPDMSGLEVVEAIQEVAPGLPVIMITGYASVPTAVEAMKLWVLDYVKKPFTSEELLELVEKALSERQKQLLAQSREEALKDFQRAIHGTLNLQEVLNLITEGVVKVMECKGSTVGLMGHKRQTLRVLAAYGLSDDDLSKGPIDVQRSIGEMFSTGRHVWVADVTTDPRIQYPQEALREGIRSIRSVPILHRNRVTGALRVYNAEPREFSEDEIRFLYDFGEQVGVAIEHARSYESLVEESESMRDDLWEWYEYDAWRLGGEEKDSGEGEGTYLK